jgi:hypothetical protein
MRYFVQKVLLQTPLSLVGPFDSVDAAHAHISRALAEEEKHSALIAARGMKLLQNVSYRVVEEVEVSQRLHDNTS